MQRRYSFILVEIALGLTLIVLALGPLVGSMARRFKYESTLVQSLEQEWESDWEATEWFTRIAQRETPLPTTSPIHCADRVTLTRTGVKQGASLFELSLGTRKYRFYHVDGE